MISARGNGPCGVRDEGKEMYNNLARLKEQVDEGGAIDWLGQSSVTLDLKTLVLQTMQAF